MKFSGIDVTTAPLIQQQIDELRDFARGSVWLYLGFLLVLGMFFFSGYMFTPEQLSNGFVMSVIVLVGAGTVLHSVMDCSISVLLWKFIRAAVPSIKLIRG